MENQNDIRHYGVKGMHWGVRKDRHPTAVVTKTRPGKRVKATGGKYQPASSDAIKTAEYRQKAKKSTPSSLSNAELQALVQRMNLEQQYSRLASQDSKLRKGNEFTKQILGLGKTMNDAVTFASSPASSALKNSLKK